MILQSAKSFVSAKFKKSVNLIICEQNTFS